MSQSSPASRRQVVTPSSHSVRLPPGPRLPGFIQAISLILFPPTHEAFLQRRWPTFFVRSLAYGPTVVNSEPALAKRLLRAWDDVNGVEPSLDAASAGVPPSDCTAKSISDAGSC
jgi:hypothetical protein